MADGNGIEDEDEAIQYVNRLLFLNDLREKLNTMSSPHWRGLEIVCAVLA